LSSAFALALVLPLATFCFSSFDDLAEGVAGVAFCVSTPVWPFGVSARRR